MATAIDIRELSKVFTSSAGRTAAVDGVTLRIDAGELFFLLGPSGCGKTTLLRMIAGFIEPTGGSILFNGRDITGVPPNKRNTGMVFQSYALWPHMTVEANVAFGLTVRKVPAAERARRVAEALEAVRMSSYASRKPNQLSGGQQQRVALARALVIRPDVLLLDEPLSNLDAKLRLELRSEIRRVCKEAGLTAVYVTHDQKEALSMADRVAVLDAGRLAQLGTPRELYRRPASRFVAEFLGETNFIPGTVVGRAGGRVTVRTAAGSFESRDGSGGGRPAAAGPAAGLADGARVLVSIRPEAWKLLDGGGDVGVTSPSPSPFLPERGVGGAGGGQSRANVLAGRVADVTYLGDVAQLLIETPGLTGRLKASSLNPAAVETRAAGSPISLGVAAEDVVLVPEGG